MKKRAYIKNQIQGVRRTKARFFSIFVIIFLGSAFYAGLRHAPMIMENSIESYLETYNYEDINIIGTLGFSKSDISLLDDIEEIESYEIGLRFDALLEHLGTDYGVTVYTQDKFEDSINQAVLLEGEYPSQDDECFIDAEFADNQQLEVGDIVELESAYDTKEFQIVGIGQDTRYMSIVERGSNTLGDGSNSGFVLIYTSDNEFLALPQDLYDLREENVLYNDIRISLKNENNYSLFSDKYDSYVQGVSYSIKNIYYQLFDDLYLETYSEYNELYEEGYLEYSEGLVEYETGYATFETEIANAKIQIIDAKQEIIENEQRLLEVQVGMQETTVEVTQEIDALQANLTALSKQLEDTLADLELKQEVSYLEDYLSYLNEQIKDANESLDTLDEAMDDLLAYNAATLALEEARLEVEIAENEIELKEIELEKEFAEIKSTLEEANEELISAKQQLDAIPKGTIVPLTNNENAGFLTFEANAGSMRSISLLFPLIFFLVAALVSLTTMTRMIEEQRLQSGTLLALGYSKKDVLMQYVYYALFATFIASVLGIIAGVYFFPWIIYFLYTSILYGVQAPVQIQFDFFICFQTIFISVVITLLVTIYVCYQEVMELPAVLLRPKPPKSGKRIILERIDFIWKRLSFNRKVTMRNIFRYKKRFIMSVIGIAGCTALMVTGFGLRDSISRIVTNQFGEIWTNDATISYSEAVNQQSIEEIESLIYELGNISGIHSAYSQVGIFAGVSKDYLGTVVVPENADDFEEFVHLYDYQTGDTLLLEDQGVVISQKLSELLGVDVNDYVAVTFDNQTYSVKITGICEQYYTHYIYMSKVFYKSLTGKDATYNTAYVGMVDNSESSIDKLSDEFLDLEEVSGSTFLTTVEDSFQNQLAGVTSVVIILVICAGCLAFVVLYNLTNINIQERKSEIATIKVLGFYKKEVNDYVFRENMILSFIGALVGCVIGKLIHMYLMPTIEIEVTMFVRDVFYSTYLISIIITMMFTYVINHRMAKVIKKIDMIESLKSIE